MNDDLSRERVINGVLSRIAAAPRIERVPGLLGGYARLARPLLTAAAAIIIVSAIALATAARRPADGGTVEAALGLTAPVARYVATHDVEPWSVIADYRNQR